MLPDKTFNQERERESESIEGRQLTERPPKGIGWPPWPSNDEKSTSRSQPWNKDDHPVRCIFLSNDE